MPHTTTLLLHPLLLLLVATQGVKSWGDQNQECTYPSCHPPAPPPPTMVPPPPATPGGYGAPPPPPYYYWPPYPYLGAPPPPNWYQNAPPPPPDPIWPFFPYYSRHPLHGSVGESQSPPQLTATTLAVTVLAWSLLLLGTWV